MSDYIEREFALNVLCRENCGHDYEANKCNNCYTSNFINYLPTADVAEVKHGKWRWKSTIESDEDCYICFCSCCGKECGNYYDDEDDMIYYIRQNYCPNCGAKMDLED